MTNQTTNVIGGVDTHKCTHYAAAIDDNGRLLGHREFPANARGYAAMLTWMRSRASSCRSELKAPELRRCAHTLASSMPARSWSR